MSRRSRRGRRGQGTVEFALVFPLVAVTLLGLISASWLFFQSSALADGARSGVREATLETSLDQAHGGQNCESGSPLPIETAVAKAAPELAVNPSPLCYTPSPGSGRATTLTQAPDPHRVSITVVAMPSLANATTVTVTVSYPGQGVAPPLSGMFPMTASSQLPMVVS